MTAPLEALAFLRRIKPALRLRLGAEDAARETARWRGEGAAVVGGDGLLYVAWDLASAEALERAEATIRPDGAPRAPDDPVLEAHRELGRQLGYPSCCVEAFLQRLVRGVHVRPDGGRASERVVAVEQALARSRRRLARLNFLLPGRRALVPFDPCAFDCPAALEYADALYDVHRNEDPAAAAKLQASLSRTARVTIDDTSWIDVSFDDF